MAQRISLHYAAIIIIIKWQNEFFFFIVVAQNLFHLLTAPVDNVYLTFLHVRENSRLGLSCKSCHVIFTLKVLSFS